MGDGTAVILNYAQPQASQPTGSSFAVQLFDDGVELTRTLSARPIIGAVLAAVAAVTLLSTTLAVGERLNDRYAQGGEWPVVSVVVVLLVGIAARLLNAARVVFHRQLQRVTLRGGQLTAANCLLTMTGRPWVTRHPRSAFATATGSDLLRGHRLGAVSVRGPLGTSRTVLTGLSRDEAVWVAAVLNDAIAAGR